MVPVAETYTNGGANVAALVATSPRDVWAIGNLLTDRIPVAMHLSGAAWRETSLPIPIALPGICDPDAMVSGGVAVGGSTRWAVGSTFCDEAGGQLALTERWDGTRWRTVKTGLGYNTHLTAIDASSPRDVWAAGGRNDLKRGLVERWNGVRWTAVPFSLARPGLLSGIAVASPRDVWAVGEGMIVRYSGRR